MVAASSVPRGPDPVPSSRRVPASATQRTALAWMGTGLFVLCLAVRTPDLFRHPRFWAEEGALYFRAMRDLPLLGALSFVANGNYQFLTNLFVELSILSPPRQAAVATTYLPLAVAAYGAFLMARVLVSSGCSAVSVAVACLLFAAQTAGYEVFLSATNVQWVCSAVALLLALQDDVGATSAPAWRRYAALAACGLTGTPSCILLPLFLALAWLRPTRYRFTLAAVLAAAAALQCGVILAHAGQVHRQFQLTPQTLAAFVLHTVLAGFLPVDGVESMTAVLRAHGPHWGGSAAQLTLVGLAGLGILTVLARDRLGAVLAVALAATAVQVGLVNAFGQLGKADDLLGGWAGARYFFCPSTCLIVILAAGSSADVRSLRVVAGLLVFMALGDAALSRIDAGWSGLFMTGPSVSGGVDRCRVAGPCRVPVGPNGSGMAVDLIVTGRDLPASATPSQ